MIEKIISALKGAAQKIVRLSQRYQRETPANDFERSLFEALDTFVPLLRQQLFTLIRSRFA